MSQKIIVLGAGPAGVVCAFGLAELGYQVEVVSEFRRFSAVEGVSARVVQAIQQAGLLYAAQTIEQASLRGVYWNGEYNEQNQEYLLDRPVFDQALRKDLELHQIKLHESLVTKVTQVADLSTQLSVNNSIDKQQVTLATGEVLIADFIVDARGRSAPLSGKGQRGPETLSILNRWQGKVNGSSKTCVFSVRDGWVWMAQLASGLCYWQLTTSAKNPAIPKKEHLLTFSQAHQAQHEEVAEFFKANKASRDSSVDVYTRSSTSTLSAESCGTNWIRIGDAAMAVDSLSGNGVFQSLSSALQAPAVINTLLKQPEQAALAQQFHQQRIEHLFMRFARLGRDFYQVEQRWTDQSFWQERSNWPDQQLMHKDNDFSKIKVVKAAVVSKNFIVEDDVVITPDQPLGMWHLSNIKLATVISRLAQESLAYVLKNYSTVEQQHIIIWLHQHGYFKRDKGSGTPTSY